jgi:hypothetical protein
MFGFFKKFNNSVEFPKLIFHMFEQQNTVNQLFILDPYNNLDEVLTLFFYFNRDIGEKIDSTNYTLESKIYFKGGNEPLGKLFLELTRFFFQVSEAMQNDRAYIKLLEEIGNKDSLLYEDLDKLMPKNFLEFKVYKTELLDMYIPMTIHLGFN